MVWPEKLLENYMSKKLVIKINNLGAIDEDALARKHEVEQLLWGRIVGAIAAGVVLLLLAVWFVFQNLQVRRLSALMLLQLTRPLQQ